MKKDEVFGVAGESGCGKSTLAFAIMQYMKPPRYLEDGKIIFDGINLLKLDKEKLREIRWKRISLIPQSAMNALNPVMKVKEQIADAIMAHEKISKEDLSARILELLDSVGLPPRVAEMYPHELSGGMKQRAIIAMAIALQPELIIADEPTTALDVAVQRLVLQTILNVRRKLRSSLILITHDMGVQAASADRLGIMYAGKMVEVGDVVSIYKNPLHPYTELLISAIPSIKKKKTLKGISGLPPDLINPPSGCRFHPRCPYAMEICKKEEPEIREISSQLVACHLYN